MTRYKSYIQKIHSVATASAIEMGVLLITEDVCDYLVNSGVQADSNLIKEIRKLKEYEYKPKAKE
jgi:hypothetical protein